jgi:hypothetical protein
MATPRFVGLVSQQLPGKLFGSGERSVGSLYAADHPSGSRHHPGVAARVASVLSRVPEETPTEPPAASPAPHLAGAPAEHRMP